MSVGVNNLARPKNFVATVWVDQPLLFYEVDFSAVEDGGEFFTHLGIRLQGQGLETSKVNQNVYIAVGVKIIAQCRAEQSHLGNALSLAKAIQTFEIAQLLHGKHI